ncbi:hypothetical protein LT330_007692 [Penicillium expansum]|nr:hypothetical protein LT330_007692 [Penicillium expansum]
MAEALAIIFAYAEGAGAILGAIKTGSELLGGFSKPPDTQSKKILEEIARLEVKIIDVIHTAFLNEHIIQIANATHSWNDAWPQIINAGITYENIGDNGILHSVEEDMSGQRDDVGDALIYFQTNPLPTTPGMLDIVLGGYTLKLSMDTVNKAFTWVRRLHKGITAPPDGMKELAALLEAGQDNVDAWVKKYQERRTSQLGHRLKRELAGDEIRIPRVWDFNYFVTSDLGGDSIIPTFEQNTMIGTIPNRTKSPPDHEVNALIAGFVRSAWMNSEKGLESVDAVYRQWNGIKGKVTELIT